MSVKVVVANENKTILAEKNSFLLDILVKNGISILAPCGKNGKCGKCKVKLLSGRVGGENPDENGMIKSCKAYLTEDIIIELSHTNHNKINISDNAKSPIETTEFGVALDIGTTTIAALLVDLKDGKAYKKATCFNPQCVYGADVLSRITACSNGNLKILQDLIVNKINDILNIFSNNGETNIKELTVAANTTMLHILLGVDPTPMGSYPFSPTFTDFKKIKGESLGISVKNITVLPSVSAFIGADITAGILATDIHKSKENVLFVDVGTNGEIVLKYNSKLFAASTAAGPALEGASMECGVSGVSGAINRVFLRGGKFGFTTIDNATAKGICGSGYVDLIALLLKEDLIDKYGGWNYSSNSFLVSKLIDDRFYLTEDVFLSKGDISEFQLAKAAIMAGIKSLINYCNVDIKDITQLYLVGGMGYYINPQNAAITGLLPYELAYKATANENTALLGAKLCLLSEQSQKEVEKIAADIGVVELSFLENFQKEYTNNLFFKL